VLSLVLPVLLVVAVMPRYIGFLKSKNRLTPDAHKTDGSRVPTPAGPVLIVALIAGELAVYAYYHTPVPLVLTGVTLIAGVIGLVDDLHGLGGKIKPALLLLAAGPIILGVRVYPSLFSSQLYFPIFGATGTHMIIYSIFVLAAMPVLSNAFNMMDVFNGEISGFSALTSGALVVGVFLRAYALRDYSVERIAIAVPLLAVSLSFHLFHRHPSKIFDGDSGSLALGATYGAVAILSGVEFAALVAVIPAVLNSFYILASVRNLIEHRQMRARPTSVGEDGKLHANDQEGAPTTLARMILLDGPLTEKEIVRKIYWLTFFACFLSVVTSVLTWVVQA
jgi:UDP-GlcNAc:undecaprenyl-phosphate GlcNAc-1-phosphate transferase